MSSEQAGGPEASVEAALLRARDHARNALAEGIEAGRALLDAASLATSGARAAEHPTFATADRWLHQASRGIATESEDASALLNAIAEALDAEIERWEARAAKDPDARAVLRAFLGVRELLWELGVRRESKPEGEPAPVTKKRAGRKVRRRTVTRVPIEG
jgi:hypothetical protein